MKLKIDNKYDVVKITKYLSGTSLSNKKMIKRYKKIIQKFNCIFNDLTNLERVMLLEVMQNSDLLKEMLVSKVDFFTTYINYSKQHSVLVINEYIKAINNKIESFGQIKKFLEANLNFDFFKAKNLYFNKNIFNLNSVELFKMKKYILNYYNLNKKLIIHSTVKSNIIETNDYAQEFLENYDDIYELFFEKIFEELINQQNFTIMDFNYINQGAYSIVYEIGDNILKIGSLRCTHNIPNSKYILQPLIRLELKDIYGYIEIMNKVKTCNISDDDVYKVYSELRKEGITWFDPGIRNLGILLKDNYPFYNNEYINVDQTFNGFNKNNSEVLKAGEYVIDDIDTLSNEKYFDFDGDDVTHLCLNYESRYQKERKK